MQNLDDEVILELTGVVFECRELGFLDAEVAILPDGRFEVLHPKSSSLTWIPSLSYKYGMGLGEDYGLEVVHYYEDKLLRFRPVLDRISRAVSKVVPPEEEEIKVIPILNFLA